MRRGDRRLGRRRRRARRRWPRPGSTCSCSRPGGTTTATTTRATTSTRSPTLYRDAGLTDRRGQARRSRCRSAKVVGGTTVINSGTCFRAPDEVLEDWRERARDRAGRRDLDPYFAEAEEFLRVTPLDPERMGRNGQLAMEGAAALGAAAGRSPATPATASSAAPAPSAAGSTPSAACTSATCRARSPPGPGSGPGSRRAGCWSRTAARSGSSASAGRGERLPARAYTVRARRAMIVAGGAFGTPELLLRSGLGGAPGRPQPPHPPRLLGRRPLRGGGARLGGRHAELLRRRVGAERVLLEATFTPLAFGGAWLPGAGRAHQEAMLDFGHIASIGVQLADRSAGRVGLARRRLAAGHLQADRRRRRPLRLRDRPRRRNPLRRRRHRGLPEHPAGRGAASPASSPSSRRPASSPPSCASRPSTRWAPRGSQPTPAPASATPSGAVRGVEGLYVADASLFPTAVGVNPMMTIIAFAKQVAAGIADGDPGPAGLGGRGRRRWRGRLLPRRRAGRRLGGGRRLRRRRGRRSLLWRRRRVVLRLRRLAGRRRGRRHVLVLRRLPAAGGGEAVGGAPEGDRPPPA